MTRLAAPAPEPSGIRLSVLVCSCNGSRTLADCLAALCAQAGPDAGDYEIVVVDNGSTDGTPQIARDALAASGIPHRIFEERRPGKVNALYAGLRLCRGEYVTIVDDDNILSERFLARVIRFFEDRPDVGMIGSHNRLSGAEPPDWFPAVAGRYACAPTPNPGATVADAGDGRLVSRFAVPPGAGSSFRRRPVVDALDLGFFFINGVSTYSRRVHAGEDAELCFLFAGMGWHFGIDPDLRLDHRVAGDRLTKQALLKLGRNAGKARLGIDLFIAQNAGQLGSVRFSWGWSTLRAFRSLLAHRKTLLGLLFGAKVGIVAHADACTELSAFGAAILSFGRVHRLARLRALRPWSQLNADQYV